MTSEGSSVPVALTVPDDEALDCALPDALELLLVSWPEVLPAEVVAAEVAVDPPCAGAPFPAGFKDKLQPEAVRTKRERQEK